MTNSNSLKKYIHIKQGDITLEDTDAIVNAANPTLLGGGGVDGAIHRSAGYGLLEECKKLGGCKHGEARITSGYNLKANYIIHTPGPIYRDGKNGEKQILVNSYMNSLLLAKKNNIKSISFPAISSGVYGYPKEDACEVAITTAIDFLKTHEYIIDTHFVLFDKNNFEIYYNFLDTL